MSRLTFTSLLLQREVTGVYRFLHLETLQTRQKRCGQAQDDRGEEHQDLNVKRERERQDLNVNEKDMNVNEEDRT